MHSCLNGPVPAVHFVRCWDNSRFWVFSNDNNNDDDNCNNNSDDDDRTNDNDDNDIDNNDDDDDDDDNDDDYDYNNNIITVSNTYAQVARANLVQITRNASRVYHVQNIVWQGTAQLSN